MKSILGTGSDRNKFQLINTELSRSSKTVYVKLTGDDVDGDGSEGNPFATIAKALQEAVGTIRQLYVNLGAGVHTHGQLVVNHIYASFSGDGSIEYDAAGVSFVSLTDGHLALSVPVKNVGVTAYTSFAIMKRSSVLLLLAQVDTDATSELIRNYSGQNAVEARGCAISATSPITKTSGVSENSAIVSIGESSVTYTNIT